MCKVRSALSARVAVCLEGQRFVSPECAAGGRSGRPSRSGRRDLIETNDRGRVPRRHARRRVEAGATGVKLRMRCHHIRAEPRSMRMRTVALQGSKAVGGQSTARDSCRSESLYLTVEGAPPKAFVDAPRV